MGLEWAYRLMRDPRRLFVRYCIEPWSLIPAALDDLRTARRRRGDSVAEGRRH